MFPLVYDSASKEDPHELLRSNSAGTIGAFEVPRITTKLQPCNMCHGEGPTTAATTASAAMAAVRSYPQEAVKLIHLLQHAALEPEILQAALLQVSS